MYKLPLIIMAIGIYCMICAQDSDSLNVADSSTISSKKSNSLALELDKMVVTATRSTQSAFSSARTVTIADKKEIAEKNLFSALDIFDDKIGIWIEKRTTTTSDPVIRGLSGGNILALMDGNTISTFWGEGGFAGDDMYGKIDGESIERIEVVRGPASVIYGSNALGGVINFLSRKSPIDYLDEGFQIGGKLKGASGSASEYVMGRIETWGATPRLKYFAGGTIHRSDNMRVGGDIGYIMPSGGKDWSFDINAEGKINENNYIELGGQYMNRPKTYRSYRPTQSNSNERLGLNLGYKWTKRTFFSDQLKMNVYHQYKKDFRYWYNNNSLQTIKDKGFAWWKTYTADMILTKSITEKNKLTYGGSYHLDVAESPDDEQFTMETPFGEQKAAPGTKWHNAAAYLHDEWDLIPLLTLSGGIRYDYFFLVADEDTFFTKPGDPDFLKNRALTDPAEYSQNAITGGAAAVFHLGKYVNLATSWARGFRMYPPSFGFRQTGQGVLVPNGLLDPVVADMFEITPRLKTKALGMYITGYYTTFRNFQQPVYGTYMGDTAIDYNNNGSIQPDEKVYITAANGEAFVTGVEGEIDFAIGEILNKLDGFHLICGAMYNYGKMKYPGTEELPFRHTHPPRGIIKFRYDDPSPQKRGWFEFSADIVAKYDQIEKSRLTSDVGYLENPQEPNSGLYCNYGLPSYQVFDIRGGLTLNQHISASLAIENVLDTRYRTAHSRMDASGRNFLVGLELSL